MPDVDAALFNAHREHDAVICHFLEEVRPQIVDALGQADMSEPRQFGLFPPTAPMTRLMKLLGDHPLFKEERTMWVGNGGVGTGPRMADSMLLYLSRHTVEEAIEWARRVTAAKSSKVAMVSEVRGLSLRRSMTFVNRVNIGRVSDISWSRHARGREAQSKEISRYRHADFTHPTFAWKIVEGSTSGERPFEHTENAREETLEVLDALALDEHASPTSAFWWTEPGEDDFRFLAINSGGSMGNIIDGPEVHRNIALEQTTLERVNRYLALSGKHRSRCRTALQGLHLARRLRDPGRKAIEVSIGLEAILGMGGNTEIIHKVATRGAIVLGGTLAERVATKKALKALYSLRSKKVHGDEVNTSLAESIQIGLEVANKIFRAAVEHGEEFDVDTLDLVAQSPHTRPKA